MSRSPHPAQPSQRDVGDALTDVVKARLRAHVEQIGAFSVPGAGGWAVEVDPDEPVDPDSPAIVVVARRAEDGRRLLFDLRIDAYASPHVPPGWGWYRRGPGVPDFAVGDRVEMVVAGAGLPEGLGEVVEVLGDMSDPRPGYRVQLDDADTYETVVVPPEGLVRGDRRE